MTAISSLITAIMLGSFSQIIPGFNPLDIIYNVLFGQHLPEYLYDGLSSVGLFSLIYSLICTVFYPIYCRIGVSPDTDIFDRLSKEDLVYLPLVYLVYVYVIYINGNLSTESLIVGLLSIPLPFIYRLIVYFTSYSLTQFSNTCYYPTVVFVVSLGIAVVVTVLYELVIHFAISMF